MKGLPIWGIAYVNSQSKPMSKRFPLYVPTSGGRELISFPEEEQQVVQAGGTAIRVTKPNPIVLPPEGYRPRNEKEDARLQAHPAYGTQYTAIEPELEEAAAQASTDEEGEASDEDVPTGDDEDGEAASSTGSHEDIVSKAGAAEVLTSAPFNLPVNSLQSEAGNLTKARIREAASQVGVDFPNL